MKIGKQLRRARAEVRRLERLGSRKDRMVEEAVEEGDYGKAIGYVCYGGGCDFFGPYELALASYPGLGGTKLMLVLAEFGSVVAFLNGEGGCSYFWPGWSGGGLRRTVSDKRSDKIRHHIRPEVERLLASGVPFKSWAWVRDGYGEIEPEPEPC